jgi:hypothetical protein
MRSILLLASVAGALAFGAPDAAAQSAPAPAARGLYGSPRTPLPASLAPSAARTASLPVEGARGKRSAWRYPALGAVAGTLVGAVVGTSLMVGSDEWMAPPAHILTVPAGALLGLAIGGVVNLLDPPSR